MADDSVLSHVVLSNYLEDLDAIQLCDFCNSVDILLRKVKESVKISCFQGTKQASLTPISIIFLGLTVPLIQTGRVIQQINELYEQMRVQTGMRLIEPKYVILTSFGDKEDRRRFQCLGDI